MKKIIALLLVTLMVLSCVGCTKPAEPTTDEPEALPKVGCVIFNYANNFLGYVRRGIEFNAKGVADLTVSDAQNDQTKENEIVDNYISQGVQVLAINLVDSQSASIIIEKARAAEIPVIFFNKNPSVEDLNSYDKCWYVGVDASNQGKLQGEMVAQEWTARMDEFDTNGDGVLQLCIVQGEPGHSDTPLRTDALIKALDDSGIKYEIMEQQPANWNTQAATDLVETWIGKHGDKMELIACNNDAMAIGAVAALQANGLVTDEDFIPVVGVNALPEAAELIRSGYLLGSILTDPTAQGKAVVELSVNAAKGAADPTEGTDWVLGADKDVRIPDVIVTKENVDTAITAYIKD